MIAFVGFLALYVALAGGVTYWLSTLGATSGTKAAIVLSSILGFLLFAVWDEVWGYVYLRHLCSTESGVKVYRTVTLGPEYWNDDGSPKFISFEGSNAFKPFLDGRYQLTVTGATVSRWPEVVRSEQAVVELPSAERLAVHTTFRSERGWILQATGVHLNRRVCQDREQHWDRTLISSVFRKSSSK